MIFKKLKIFNFNTKSKTVNFWLKAKSVGLKKYKICVPQIVTWKSDSTIIPISEINPLRSLGIAADVLFFFLPPRFARIKILIYGPKSSTDCRISSENRKLLQFLRVNFKLVDTWMKCQIDILSILEILKKKNGSNIAMYEIWKVCENFVNFENFTKFGNSVKCRDLEMLYIFSNLNILFIFPNLKSKLKNVDFFFSWKKFIKKTIKIWFKFMKSKAENFHFDNFANFKNCVKYSNFGKFC